MFYDANIPQNFHSLSMANLQETNSVYFKNLVANLQSEEQGELDGHSQYTKIITS